MDYKGPFQYKLRRNTGLLNPSTSAHNDLAASTESGNSSVPTLPVELLRLIVCLVDNRPTLTSFVLASRTFHDVAIPVLYNTVDLEDRWKSGTSDLFFYGLQSNADRALYDRKASYLRHLRHLMLWEAPSDQSSPLPRCAEEALFPNLVVVEYMHRGGGYYAPLFSLFTSVRHLCIRTFSGLRLFDEATRAALSGWTSIECLTFYQYTNLQRASLPTEEVGFPLSWRKLQRVLVYPGLGNYYFVPGFVEPDPFLYMPKADSFPHLKEFIVFIPTESERYRELYSKSAQRLGEPEQALIDVRVGKTAGGRWVVGWI